MKIRQVRRADRNEWLRMRQALWPGARGDHAAEVDAMLGATGPETTVFVAEGVGGILAGFVEVSQRPYAEGCRSSPVAFLEGLWVEPGHRAQGLGRQLVAAAEDWARRNGLSEIASDVDILNLPGQATHLALGFAETERIVCYRKSL